jgi:hypothetical protein
VAFLILCPACLQRLELPGVDPTQLAAAGGVLCTCVRCGTQLKRDEKGWVVPADEHSLKLFAIPHERSRAVVRRVRRGRVVLRVRGWFGLLLSKRVIVTSEQVEIRLWIRPRLRRIVPLAHVRGVVIMQRVFLSPPSAIWGTYLLFDELWIALAGFSHIDHAIEHASAINISLMAHKPAGDPYRGLLPAAARE